MKKNQVTTVKFIDLFAGIGGTRLGFEQACNTLGYKTKCVFTSEIKQEAVKVYKKNFPKEEVQGDITCISSDDIPDFDFLLAGFPCQPFSSAGSRKGFVDTRGTLFFEIERILRDKNPSGFLLENVEGLVNHDKVSKSSKIGRTLETILSSLNKLGYKTVWKVLDASDFGVPQKRKRIYIIGRKDYLCDLENIQKEKSKLADVLETKLKVSNSTFIKKLLDQFELEKLYGKSIKDKRGGHENIHSWDFGLKGDVSIYQKELLNKILTERRKKQWASKKGIEWMDGMPLTLKEIKTFWQPKLFHLKENLFENLEKLTQMGYLRYEYPKDIVKKIHSNGVVTLHREYRNDLEKGYNIVTGKLSFEVSKILNPQTYAPTLVATDMSRIYVPDNGGIRKLTERESLRLFGYPESFNIGLDEEKNFDLLGNTVAVNVIKKVALRLLCNYS